MTLKVGDWVKTSDGYVGPIKVRWSQPLGGYLYEVGIHNDWKAENLTLLSFEEASQALQGELNREAADRLNRLERDFADQKQWLNEEIVEEMERAMDDLTKHYEDRSE